MIGSRKTVPTSRKSWEDRGEAASQIVISGGMT